MGNDLVERQAAIDAVQSIGRLATLPDNDAVIRMSAVEYVLFNMSSAQPKLEQNTTSGHEGNDKLGVKNGKTCTDTISRQAATQATLEFIVEYLGGAFDEELQKKLMGRMNALPSVQPELIEQSAYIRGFEQGKTQGMLNAKQPVWEKDIIQKFHDYQIEWLKNHYDLELEPQLEEAIIRFLHDTANMYMLDTGRETDETD